MFTKGSLQQMILTIMWIGLHIRWIPVSLFLQLYLPSPNGLMNKVGIMAGMEVILLDGVSNMDFHSPRPHWLCSPLNTQFSSSRDRRWNPNLAPFPRMSSQLTRWQVDHTSIIWGGTFCSYWNRYLFWIWIYLPCMQCFCQNYHLWTFRMTCL